jgi:hypothetical protein
MNTFAIATLCHALIAIQLRRLSIDHHRTANVTKLPIFKYSANSPSLATARAGVGSPA